MTDALLTELHRVKDALRASGYLRLVKLIDREPLTAEAFERAYARRSGFSVEILRKHRTVRPCDCGEDGCEGWQSISHERAAEYDKAHPHPHLGSYGA